MDHSAELQSEQDLERFAQRAPTWVDSIGEALQLLNPYPWLQLYPR